MKILMYILLTLIIVVTTIGAIFSMETGKLPGLKIPTITLPKISINTGFFKKKPISTPIPTPSAKQALTTDPSPTISKTKNDLVWITNVYFGEYNGEPLMKVEFLPISEKAYYIGLSEKEKERTVSIYKQDIARDPEYTEKYNNENIAWLPLVSMPVTENADVNFYTIGHRLFSFKKVPNTKLISFVMEWATTYEFDKKVYNRQDSETVLYVFNTETEELKLMKKFNRNKYVYAKIESFSPESKYMELKLFGCWNCGGHQPQTLLIDLNTFNSKNLEFVSYFNWGASGQYEYKEYKTYPCDSTNTGECMVDPKELPPLYGSI